ncbi:MAG TPA: Rrf2 family transcriptional regulator [Candidatus Eisenbergiella intestinipullorum]|nr:Rrf2 family transcriptional regulator [Candidatus Eisenbergiella intestinipullorum]
MNSNFCVAVHGLIYLYFCQSTVSSEELAKHVCTNPARVRKVMLMLKKQGLVQTREGKDGGYRCGTEAGEITLAQIAEATETHFAEGFRTGKGCAGKEGGEGLAQLADLDRDCLNASGMAQVMQELYEQMDALCMERLGRITVAHLEARLRIS